MDFRIRPLNAQDRVRVADFIAERWHSDSVVVHGTIYRPARLPGFVAVLDREWVGLVTYQIVARECEIVSLDSLQVGIGIGTALLGAVEQAARRAKCRRIWLITTNDNLTALRFYQKRGFSLVAVHRRAVEQARMLKPEIPAIGQEGIPIRDEIELELSLAVP
jgi:GNAT superfamily N-acetyltransferase